MADSIFSHPPPFCTLTDLEIGQRTCISNTLPNDVDANLKNTAWDSLLQ